MPQSHKVLKSGVVFSGGGPTEIEKQTYSLYDVVIEDEGVYLERVLKMRFMLPDV